MNDYPNEVLILGIGNLLWADEGFGVRCVEELVRRYRLPEGVTAMDGGTQGLYLLPYVQAARRLVVFDAVDFGLTPGTLLQVEDDAVPRYMGAKKMSLHQTGFQEVLAAASLTGKLPVSLLLIGAQPVELDDYGGSLRPQIRDRIGEAVELAVARLRDWGIDLATRDAAVASSLNDASLALDAYESGRPSEQEACRYGDERILFGSPPCA
ncbi:HyaD/HybD family hydrogenase maturation endopeptidase [Methylococcus sp. EFPC2]|uniref:HyaD/HybD family hydrogenase maturation endopeptidase n=1 Tax=Methylococcus sp. EFPC2 TaxID=2812648 RepID=UPI0019681DF4|nr:HyaD/HybD family hydrogenase maturation endopeptidase [Methylococcus sp. EFPC2]QSA97330.1 HyaD/HybD family hydrogenase maturation endopeptidase [Methylococcus sp. EFPC2]